MEERREGIYYYRLNKGCLLLQDVSFLLLMSYFSRHRNHPYFASIAMHTLSDKLLGRCKLLPCCNYDFSLILSYLSENELRELPEGIFEGVTNLLSM